MKARASPSWKHKVLAPWFKVSQKLALWRLTICEYLLGCDSQGSTHSFHTAITRKCNGIIIEKRDVWYGKRKQISYYRHMVIMDKSTKCSVSLLKQNCQIRLQKVIWYLPCLIKVQLYMENMILFNSNDLWGNYLKAGKQACFVVVYHTIYAEAKLKRLHVFNDYWHYGIILSTITQMSRCISIRREVLQWMYFLKIFGQLMKVDEATFTKVKWRRKCVLYMWNLKDVTMRFISGVMTLNIRLYGVKESDGIIMEDGDLHYQNVMIMGCVYNKRLKRDLYTT